MRRALNAVISLYPREWRDRYEREFVRCWTMFLRGGAHFSMFGRSDEMQFKTGRSWKIVAACALAE